MRRTGMLECSACAIALYFDAKNPQGCVDLTSVARALSFNRGVSFDARYVDQYIPVDSTLPPEAVPALHYRDMAVRARFWASRQATYGMMRWAVANERLRTEFTSQNLKKLDGATTDAGVGCIGKHDELIN
jgi:hypothetical protein